MIIGDRFRAVREQKKFSQDDIEQRCGLLRCYGSDHFAYHGDCDPEAAPDS
jgi:hypothetical protein